MMKGFRYLQFKPDALHRLYARVTLICFADRICYFENDFCLKFDLGLLIISPIALGSTKTIKESTTFVIQEDQFFFCTFSCLNDFAFRELFLCSVVYV